jgi:acyl-coenzyme A thioesterase PaaI-like protein
MSDGYSYIAMLDPAKRAEARVWAEMPAAEFQARLGMAMGEMRDELAALRTPAWKGLLRNGGLFVGGAAAAAWAVVNGQMPPRP